jgi:threonyl-tRNA synthetase
VRVLTVSEKFTDYAKQVETKLRDAGIRVTADLGPDKVGAKVRLGAMDKVPYLAVVGDKEVQAGTVAIRERGGADLGSLTLEAFIARVDQENRTRSLPKVSE